MFARKLRESSTEKLGQRTKAQSPTEYPDCGAIRPDLECFLCLLGSSSSCFPTSFRLVRWFLIRRLPFVTQAIRSVNSLDHFAVNEEIKRKMIELFYSSKSVIVVSSHGHESQTASKYREPRTIFMFICLFRGELLIAKEDSRDDRKDFVKA